MCVPVQPAKPLGSPTYADRAAFIANMPTSSAKTCTVTDVFNSCNKISVRWVCPDGFNSVKNSCNAVRGIDTMELSYDGGWKIHTGYSEYNNLILVIDSDTCRYFCKEHHGHGGGMGHFCGYCHHKGY